MPTVHKGGSNMSKYTLEDYTLSTTEASKKLGYKPNHVRMLAATGLLPAKKMFRQWMFCDEELEIFFNALTAKATAIGTSNAQSDAEASDLLL